jgi:dGTP triphosphohydrolase
VPSSVATPPRHSRDLRQWSNDLVIDPYAKLHSAILKELLNVYVFEHPRMATYEVGQARVIRELVRAFVKALDYDPTTQTFGKKKKLGIFPSDTQDGLHDARTNPAELLRLVADHVAGMTDGYAIRLQERLSGVGIGSFNEFV